MKFAYFECAIFYIFLLTDTADLFTTNFFYDSLTRQEPSDTDYVNPPSLVLIQSSYSTTNCQY